VGKKTGPNPTDRGKSGVKRSLLTEGHGVPIGMAIEGAQRHDMKLVRATIEGLIVERPEPSEEHPQGMCLDKGYDYDEVRDILREFGFTRPPHNILYVDGQSKLANRTLIPCKLLGD
jgi:putative transposase